MRISAEKLKEILESHGKWWRILAGRILAKWYLSSCWLW